MPKKQNNLFAEILQKELDKVFEQHIEDLKDMKVKETRQNEKKLHKVGLYPFLER